MARPCLILIVGLTLFALPYRANSEVVRPGEVLPPPGSCAGPSQENDKPYQFPPPQAAFLVGMGSQHDDLLCVNGFTIAPTEETAITMGGTPIRLTDIPSGTILEIEATPDPITKTMKAKSIAAQQTLLGQLDDYMPSKRMIKVMNEWVQLTEPYDVRTIQKGRPTMVSGIRREDGILEAGYVETGDLRRADGSFNPPLPQVTGVYQKSKDTTDYIGKTAVSLASPPPESLPKPGEYIRAYGQGFELGRMVVSTVERPAPYSFTAKSPGAFISLMGVLQKDGPPPANKPTSHKPWLFLNSVWAVPDGVLPPSSTAHTRNNKWQWVIGSGSIDKAGIPHINKLTPIPEPTSAITRSEFHRWPNKP